MQCTFCVTFHACFYITTSKIPTFPASFPLPLAMTESVFGKGEYFWTNVFHPLTERLVPDIGKFGRVLNTVKVKLLKAMLALLPIYSLHFYASFGFSRDFGE
jgi:hypothetical protein